MIHCAQPPPVVLDITTTDQNAVRALIKTYESHRKPVFDPIAKDHLRVTFPQGFDKDNQVVLQQLITELQSIGQTSVRIDKVTS